MSKPHRYTEQWPPIDILGQYPNWEYALDEEGESDQDETTLRPEPQQKVISEDTAYTTATVQQANGQEYIGILVGHLT